MCTHLYCCVLQDCRGRVAELFGVSVEDITVTQLEEFPGIVLVLLAVHVQCVNMFTTLRQWLWGSPPLMDQSQMTLTLVQVRM